MLARILQSIRLSAVTLCELVGIWSVLASKISKDVCSIINGLSVPRATDPPSSFVFCTNVQGVALPTTHNMTFYAPRTRRAHGKLTAAHEDCSESASDSAYSCSLAAHTTAGAAHVVT